MDERAFWLNDQLAGNAKPEVTGAYYRPEANWGGLPNAVRLEFELAYGGCQKITVELADLNSKYLGEHVPGLIFQSRMRGEIDLYLMDTLMERLNDRTQEEDDPFECGYYFDRFGMEWISDKHLERF